MSYVKIVQIPPVPKNKLYKIISHQIEKIYPGKPENFVFDFIPFRSSSGWKIVLYIIKRSFLNDFGNDKRYRGIIFPLQYLSKEKIQNVKTLFIGYSDMIEIWEFKDGVPVSIKRFSGHEPLPDQYRSTHVFSSDTSTFFSIQLADTHGSHSRISLNEFCRALFISSGRKVFFEETLRKKRDLMTPAAAVIILGFSLYLLVNVIFTYKLSKGIERETAVYLNMVQDERTVNIEFLDKIEGLKNRIKLNRNTQGINIYELLLRLKGVTDSNTVIRTFDMTDRRLFLSLKSKNAISAVRNIKKEFGNIKVSGIRIMPGGYGEYNLWVELE
ncbi:MAG: hypothetical protein L3J12_07115 [Spirochaetales bacterium]|nr:hypothetical protein [Spirochaetales bacterium]